MQGFSKPQTRFYRTFCVEPPLFRLPFTTFPTSKYGLRTHTHTHTKKNTHRHTHTHTHTCARAKARGWGARPGWGFKSPTQPHRTKRGGGKHSRKTSTEREPHNTEQIRATKIREPLTCTNKRAQADECKVARNESFLAPPTVHLLCMFSCSVTNKSSHVRNGSQKNCILALCLEVVAFQRAQKGCRNFLAIHFLIWWSVVVGIFVRVFAVNWTIPDMQLCSGVGLQAGLTLFFQSSILLCDVDWQSNEMMLR